MVIHGPADPPQQGLPTVPIAVVPDFARVYALIPIAVFIIIDAGTAS